MLQNFFTDWDLTIQVNFFILWKSKKLQKEQKLGKFEGIIYLAMQ